MERKIFTYALLKSFYDTGRDYIDCFCPFVLNAMRDLGRSDLPTIQERVGQTTGLNIPQYTLKTILKRAKKRGYAKVLGGGKYDVTKDGAQISAELREQESLEQQLGELSTDLAGFLHAHGNRAIDDAQAFSILSDFIQANPILVIEYLNPEIPHLYEVGSRPESGIKKDLLAFFTSLPQTIVSTCAFESEFMLFLTAATELTICRQSS